MAITLQDKLKTLPIERQEYIKKRTAELNQQEYALRAREAREAVKSKQKGLAKTNYNHKIYA